jgi:hypothetical protein
VNGEQGRDRSQGIAAEQFAYEFKGESMQIDWSVAKGGDMKLGDTMLCRFSSR